MSANQESKPQQEQQHVRKKVSLAEVAKVAEENSKFVKIKGGQTVILRFDPDKIYEIDREYEGKKSKAIEYDVIDINSGQEKIITFSLSWALNLDALLDEGFRDIKITRTNEGLDTNYQFVPVNATKK
jgi:hypothetical protein